MVGRSVCIPQVVRRPIHINKEGKMKRTQTLDIKRYLENNPKGITQRKPYNMPIVTMTKIVPNRYGGVSSVAVYLLADKSNG